MVNELFKDVQKQILDSKGRARVLIYKDNIVIITSPLPALRVEKISVKPQIPPFKKVNDFIKNKNLIPCLIEYFGSEKTFEGVWVKDNDNQLLYGYLPFQPVKKVPKEYENLHNSPSELIPPKTFEVNSDLEVFKKNRKISKYLVSFCNFLFATRGIHNENSFIIDPKHNYNIDEDIGELSLTNTNFFRDNKLIVTSETVKDRLLQNIKISKLNGTIKQTIKDGYVQNMYTELSDFEKRPNELIFMKSSELMNWLNSKKFSQKVEYFFNPESKVPYYYANNSIMKNKIVMIQNTKSGSLETALFVIDIWIKNQKNLGYLTDRKLRRNIKVNVYDAFGILEDQEIENTPYNVVKYNNGTYGAILSFD